MTKVAVTDDTMPHAITTVVEDDADMVVAAATVAFIIVFVTTASPMAWRVRHLI